MLMSETPTAGVSLHQVVHAENGSMALSEKSEHAPGFLAGSARMDPMRTSTRANHAVFRGKSLVR
jgi:hypothetical protein